jgi:transcriptional regulator with XRE-family HTH domain
MRTGSAASGARPPEQGQPHVVDVHVGQRLRSRRKLMGLSQGDLAQRVGLTFQQIQKYERGINRISASRLVEFAAVLKVSPAWFFEGIPVPHARGAGRRARRSAEIPEELGNRETLELVRLYNQIRDRRIRERIVALVQAVAFESRNAAD